MKWPAVPALQVVRFTIWNLSIKIEIIQPHSCSRIFDYRGKCQYRTTLNQITETGFIKVNCVSRQFN